jgi:hypothetical protein
MSEIELVFKRTHIAEDRLFFEMNYLDMRFTISTHPDFWQNKVFSGYRQDDRSYLPLSYQANKFMIVPKGSTKEDKAHLEMRNICSYIKDLYGFEKVTYRVEDLFNKLLEDWLEM